MIKEILKGGEKMKLNTSKVAFTFGLFLGGWHAVWSGLVALGLAQSLLNFVFWMHMLAVSYRVTGFSVMQAVILIAVTFCVGYGAGWVFATLWNMAHGK